MVNESVSAIAPVMTRVPVALKRELEQRAEEHVRSVSAEVLVLIRAGMRAEHQAAGESERS